MKESFIKHYRTLLGISQQELAEHLRISRSQLAMAESGRRQLPTAPYMALMELIQLYENVASEPISVVPSEADYADLCVSLAKNIQELQWEIAQAEHTLGKMVEHYQVGIRQQRLFIHIFKDTTQLQTPSLEKENKWSFLSQKEMDSWLEESKKDKQILLQLKIDGLKYQLGITQELLAKYLRET